MRFEEAVKFVENEKEKHPRSKKFNLFADVANLEAQMFNFKIKS